MPPILAVGWYLLKTFVKENIFRIETPFSGTSLLQDPSISHGADYVLLSFGRIRHGCWKGGILSIFKGLGQNGCSICKRS
ncbi:unnamed protein product [Allacma fusca]|uniref:Uncharacterized protein n=1 Tax=Allacma fusca TaxID=39272 RepID=A0A8J2PAF7_9HEXA|nr:unnamed protein product [Allacma fusca]